MRAISYLISFLCFCLLPRVAQSQEYCFKFSFQLLSGYGVHVDTIRKGDVLDGKFSILNCSNKPATVFNWVYEITDESENNFFCKWYKIVQVDTIPYSDYYMKNKAYIHSSEVENSYNLVDTINVGERKTFRHPLRFTETLFMDTGSYCLRVVWKYKIDHEGGYYLQESENMENIYIKRKIYKD